MVQRGVIWWSEYSPTPTKPSVKHVTTGHPMERVSPRVCVCVCVCVCSNEPTLCVVCSDLNATGYGYAYYLMETVDMYKYIVYLKPGMQEFLNYRGQLKSHTRAHTHTHTHAHGHRQWLWSSD